MNGKKIHKVISCSVKMALVSEMSKNDMLTPTVLELTMSLN